MIGNSVWAAQEVYDEAGNVYGLLVSDLTCIGPLIDNVAHRAWIPKKDLYYTSFWQMKDLPESRSFFSHPDWTCPIEAAERKAAERKEQKRVEHERRNLMLALEDNI